MNAPEGDKIVKVMKPDGTTYEASFSGKYYDHPKRGKVASIAKLLPNGEWTHTMLAPGEKIIESDEVPGSIKEFSNKLFRYVPALATRADFRDEDEVMPEPGQTPGSFIV